MDPKSLFSKENRVELFGISSQKLKDFIGWQILADDDIQLEEKQIEYYELEFKEHFYAGLKIKGKMVYSSGDNPQVAARRLIDCLAVLAVKLMA